MSKGGPEAVHLETNLSYFSTNVVQRGSKRAIGIEKTNVFERAKNGEKSRDRERAMQDEKPIEKERARGAVASSRQPPGRIKRRQPPEGIKSV